MGVGAAGEDEYGEEEEVSNGSGWIGADEMG